MIGPPPRSAAWCAPLLLLLSCAPVPAAGPASAEQAGVAGRWQPFDNASFRDLGAVTVTRQALTFAKGLTIALAPEGSAFRVIGVSGKASGIADGFCAGGRPASVALSPVDHPRPRSLRIAFYDVPTGPGPDPGFDLHRCTFFVYVR